MGRTRPNGERIFAPHSGRTAWAAGSAVSSGRWGACSSVQLPQQGPVCGVRAHAGRGLRLGEDDVVFGALRWRPESPRFLALLVVVEAGGASVDVLQQVVVGCGVAVAGAEQHPGADRSVPAAERGVGQRGGQGRQLQGLGGEGEAGLGGPAGRRRAAARCRTP